MCLVMDVLQGGDLRYHINKNGHFVEHDVILYMAEIGSALEYLRMNNIIHRFAPFLTLRDYLIIFNNGSFI